ncbi:MAG: hypothetical protein ACI92W_001805 [Paraglaciecola sp.]|jgi:uncharacterized protein YbjT (DUF2867 family)
MSEKIALIAGATGLVGRELLDLLLKDRTYSKVKVISRREMKLQSPKLEVIVEPDFDNLSNHLTSLTAHHIFCCLGTTIKLAGSEEQFIKVDLDYPLALAKFALGFADFESFHLVTAVGANADSPLFYNEIKGQVEKKVKQLDLNSLYIYQPSLLLGQRKDFRLGEELAKAFSSFISFFVIGSRRGRVWAIHSRDVAKAMQLSAHVSEKGEHTLLPKHIRKVISA